MDRKKNKMYRKKESTKSINETKNLKPVPQNCLHLVNEGDLVYVVPGNGCCGPNCAAALLFHDECFGPKLRIQMNTFQAKHWNKRYKDIAPCSKEAPFVRMLKGKEIEFTDPKELLKFLELSDDAAYMWTDSEDLAIISDMFQIKIKIITTRETMDDNPSVN